MEILAAIDRLDDLVVAAPGVPFTGRMCVASDRLRAGVAAIREEADRIWGADRAGPVAEVYAVLERLEAIVGAARVDRDELLDQLLTLRRIVPEALATRLEDRPPSPWDPVIDAVDAVEALLSAARSTPFGARLKLDAPSLRHAAARVRTVAMQNVGPPDAASGPFYEAVGELEALARGDGTLKLPADALWDLLERLYVAIRRAVA